MANISVPCSTEPSPSSNYTESTASAYVPSQQNSEMSGADTIPAASTNSDAYYANMLQQHLNYTEGSSYAIGDDTMDTAYTPPAQDKDMTLPAAHLYHQRGRLKVSAEVAAIIDAEARNGYEPIDVERADELYAQNMQALENGSEEADEEAMREMWRRKAAEYLTDNRKTRAAKGKKAAAEDNSPPSTMLNSQRAQIRKSRGNHNQHGNGVGHGHQHVYHQGNHPQYAQQDLFAEQVLMPNQSAARSVPQRSHTMPGSGRRVLGSRNPNIQTPQNYNDHQAFDKSVAEYDGSEISPSYSGYDSGFSQNGYNAMPCHAASGTDNNLQYYVQQGGYSASNAISYHDHSAPQQTQYSLTPLMSGQGRQPLVAPPVRHMQSDFYGPSQQQYVGNSTPGNVSPVRPDLIPGLNHRVRCCDRSCGSKYSKKRTRDGAPKEPRAHVSYNAHNGPAAGCRKADAFGKGRYRCLWGGCNRFFTCGRDIKAHINSVHIPRHQYKTAPNAKVEPSGYKCEWEKCPFVTKAARRYHLQSHILSHLGNAALRQLCVCGHTGKRMVDISKRHLPKCNYAQGHGITVVGQLRSIYGSDWPGDEENDDKSSKEGTSGASSPGAGPSSGPGSGPSSPPLPPASGADAAGPATRSSKRPKTSPSN